MPSALHGLWGLGIPLAMHFYSPSAILRNGGLLVIECGVVLVALIMAFAFPNFGSRFFASLERRFARLAARRGVAVVAVGLAALALRAALLPLFPIPEPIVHDEFGYLLAADTYAHGRLTNPPHPLGMHFETFSILQRPTYQCYAQPAQGMILAAGEVIAGHPFWGVWFSAGAMCAAICWMLQGWLPPAWAMLGGLLALLRFGSVSYWADSYWGGAAGAIGGALVLGALPRLVHHPQARHAFAMGVGLAILANSRPYEGFVLGLAVAAALLVWLVGRDRPALPVVARQVAAPLAMVLVLTAGAMAYYNRRVTGNPWRLPYQVEIATYGVAPYMIWQKPLPAPSFNHEVIRKAYAEQLPRTYLRSRTPAGVLLKAVRLWSFFLGPALTLPLAMVVFAVGRKFSWRRMKPRTRFLLMAGAVCLAALALETFFAPHYASPLAGLLLALVLLAMRRLQTWRWRAKRVGLFLARAVPAICVISFVLRLAPLPLYGNSSRTFWETWYKPAPPSFGRAAMLQGLDRLPGRQLVIVRYAPNRDPFEEWVYNDADIDAAKVVWAHDMGSAQNQELIRYFPDRQIFLLEPDEKPPKLSPQS